MLNRHSVEWGHARRSRESRQQLVVQQRHLHHCSQEGKGTQIIVQTGPSYKSVTTYLEHAKKIPLATQPRKTLIGKKPVSLQSIETGVSTFHTNPYHLPSLTFSQTIFWHMGQKKEKSRGSFTIPPPYPPLLADSCLALLLLRPLGYRLR